MSRRSLIAAVLSLCSCVVTVDPPADARYTCVTDDDCFSGYYCETRQGLCRAVDDPLRANGAACGSASDCESGACVGARCCATACEAQPASTCGTTGECAPDGTACARWPDGTTCSESSCAEGRFTAEGACSQGNCRVPAESQCPGNATCADGKVCKGACTLDADCPSGLFCHLDSSSPTGTVCRTQANGEACQNDVDCTHGHCVQGLCCSEACSASERTSCQTTGACKADGSGCALWPENTACAGVSCSAGNVTGSRTCDGQGACVEGGATYTCPGNLLCADTSTCLDRCGGHGDCREGFFCEQGACKPKKGLGEACAEDEQCAAGKPCVDGLCCSQDCFASAQEDCGQTGSCMANGQGCELWARDTVCSPSSCDPATAQLTTYGCDGSGFCIPETTDCPDGLGCAGGTPSTACRSQCESDSDCASGLFCMPGTAGSKSCRKKANGETCAVNGDCASSQCVGGVCCASSCLTQPASTCGTTGRCLADGSGCELWPQDTVCREASCTGVTLSQAAKCPGGGQACPAAVNGDCEGHYACAADGSSCAGSCPQSWSCNGVCQVGTHTGCASGYWCRSDEFSNLVCRAGQQLYGEPCDVSADCNYNGQPGTGFCDTLQDLCCAKAGTPEYYNPPGAPVASGQCCHTVADCPVQHRCMNIPNCINQDVEYACPATGSLRNACVEVPATVNSCDGLVSKTCPDNLAPAICPNTVCPTDCAQSGSDDDSLCAAGYFCQAGVCTQGADDGSSCTKDRACKNGKCLGGYCCNPGPTGRTCCADDAEAASVCTPICTDPTACQGKAAACINSNCSTQPNNAIDDDRACNGFANPAQRYACVGAPNWAHLYVRCNATASQAPINLCGPSGTSGCVNSYTGSQRSDVFCGDGTSCHAQYSGGSFLGSCY